MADAPRSQAQFEEFFDEDLQALVYIRKDSLGRPHAIGRPAISIRGEGDHAVNIWAVNGLLHRPVSEGPAVAYHRSNAKMVAWIEDGQLVPTSQWFSHYWRIGDDPGAASNLSGTIEVDDWQRLLETSQQDDLKFEGSKDSPSIMFFDGDQVTEFMWCDPEGQEHAEYDADGELVHPARVEYDAETPSDLHFQVHGGYNDVPHRFGHHVRFTRGGCYMRDGVTEMIFEEAGALAKEHVRLTGKDPFLDTYVKVSKSFKLARSGGLFFVNVEAPTKETLTLTVPRQEDFYTHLLAPNASPAALNLLVDAEIRKML